MRTALRAVRRRWLERRVRRSLARWDAAGRPLVVLPPLPPCAHMDSVTFPDPFHGTGTITACAYCHRVREERE